MFIPLVNGAQCTDDLVHDRRSQLHYMLSPSARSNIGEIDALSVSFCERQRELHTRHFEFTHSLRHNACCTWRLYKAWALIRQHFLSVKTWSKLQISVSSIFFPSLEIFRLAYQPEARTDAVKKALP